MLIDAEQVRDDRDVDVTHLAERLGDRIGSAVVQEAVPEASVLPLREQHGDLGLGFSEHLADELRRRSREAAVGTLDDVEGEPVEPEVLPGEREILGLDGVEVEVDRAKLVGGERAGVLDRARRGEIEVLDEHDDGVASQRVGFGGACGVVFELFCF